MYIFSIIIGFILCILYFFYPKKKVEYKETHQVVLGILFIALVAETIGDYTQANNINNSLYYNILFVYFETLLFLVFFYLIAKSLRLKYWIKSAAILFLVFGLFNTLFLQPLLEEFHNYSFVLGSLIIILLAIQFFMEILNLKRYQDSNLLSIPYFWIVTMILFFYSASFIYFSSVRVLYAYNSTIVYPIYVTIQVFAGLMYIVFGLSYFAPNVFKTKYSI